MLSKRYESTEVDRRTWLHVPSGTHWSTIIYIWYFIFYYFFIIFLLFYYFIFIFGVFIFDILLI